MFISELSTLGPGVQGSARGRASHKRCARWQASRMADDLAFAHLLADVADSISRTGFKLRTYAVREKDDGSAVTDIDVRIEEAIEGEVASAQPGDGFLSEELGTSRSGTRRRWIVDGIDGTGAFIRGDSSWGTLIALEQDGQVDIGIATSPGLRRRWWGSRGGGSWTAALGASGLGTVTERLSVSTRGFPPRGVVVPSSGVLDGWRDGAVQGASELLRSSPAVGYGPLLVAAGQAEASIHLWGRAWDHAPFVVLVEEAGGVFSDLWGGRRLDTGTAILSNGATHEFLTRRLRQKAPAEPELWSGRT